MFQSFGPEQNSSSPLLALFVDHSTRGNVRIHLEGADLPILS